MTGRVLAEIGLKTWGIIVLAGVVANLPYSIIVTAGYPDGDPQQEMIRASVIANVLGGAFIGLAMLIWGGKIARVFLPDTPELQLECGVDQLRTLCFAIVGVFILVDGLGGALSSVYEVVMRPEWDESDLYTYAWRTQREKMVKSAVQIPVGLLLVFGRQTLAERWSRIRGGL